MCLGVPDLFPAGQIPDFDNTVSASAGESLQGLWVLGHGVDAIDVTFAELGDEGSGKHALELGGIECSGVLPGSFEGVESRIKVSGLAGYT